MKGIFMKEELEQISRNKCAMTWRGFTLAEVLITLGVIGIVAALTMPALIANYQKKVVITRMQKFYSIMAQAAQMGEETYDQSMFTSVGNPDEAMEFFEINYAPYMKTVSAKKLTKGIVAALSDGSGIYITNGRISSDTNQDLMRSYFCVNYKDCENIDETVAAATNWRADNPRGVFGYYLGGGYSGHDRPREEQLTRCVNNNASCGALIHTDGWEIKDDYPW